MADFNLGSIGNLLTDGGVAAIAKRVKVKQDDVKKVLSAGIPTMIAGMKKNVSSKDGEDSLKKALGDHSLSDLSNPAAFLKGADLKDGKKILGHVFGSAQNEAVERISDASGVTKGKTLSILAIAAPLLLVLLGKQQQQPQTNALGLGSLLGGLLGGGQQQTQQSTGLLAALFGGNQQPQQQSGGLLSGLFGGGQQQQQTQQSSGLMDGLLNLFR